MSTHEQLSTLTGRTLYDRDGDKVGRIGQVWTDENGTPTWASVRTGLFGLNESLVPLRDVELRGDDAVAPYEKALIKDAPNVDASKDDPLTRSEVDRLYRHYEHNETRTTGTGDYASTSGTTDSDAMTRSEERLNVDTEREVAGRARLRKYVTTEQQQVSVPVTREEVRLEREPITEANRDEAYSGPAITESEHEVTLHRERPVVATETVPVERVRLGKETVTEEQTVGAEVRKEQIEADLPDQRGRHTRD